MTKLKLRRIYRSHVQTRGYLFVYEDDELLYQCKTLELPWKQNENRVSSIPTGTYKITHRGAHQSQKYSYPHFKVWGVEGRSAILIHAGNIYKHTLGCILPGKLFQDINGDGHPDVTSSRAVLKHLRRLTGYASTLEITAEYENDKYAKAIPEVEPAELHTYNSIEDLNIDFTKLPE